MNDRLDEIGFYTLALELWNDTWNDTEILMLDFRGKEISRQLIRAVGSISANIEEGYGRGFGKEYSHYLGLAVGQHGNPKADF
jgi:four helix bundle protein